MQLACGLSRQKRRLLRRVSFKAAKLAKAVAAKAKIAGAAGFAEAMTAKVKAYETNSGVAQLYFCSHSTTVLQSTIV